MLMATVSSYTKYTTSAGDTWDDIAYKTCGSELLSSEIMTLNRQYIGVVIFGEGTTLTIPVYDTTQDPDTLPPWRAKDES